MPRPRMRRRIRGCPRALFFKPAGKRRIDLEEIMLNLDEFEALRLKDYLGYDQEKACKEMGVSQPTFHRLLLSARKKLGDAIVNGKVIKLEGKDLNSIN